MEGHVTTVNQTNTNNSWKSKNETSSVTVATITSSTKISNMTSLRKSSTDSETNEMMQDKIDVAKYDLVDEATAFAQELLHGIF